MAQEHGFKASDSLRIMTAAKLFFRHTSIRGNGFRGLVEVEKVTFDTDTGPKGPTEINVVKR